MRLRLLILILLAGVVSLGAQEKAEGLQVDKVTRSEVEKPGKEAGGEKRKTGPDPEEDEIGNMRFFPIGFYWKDGDRTRHSFFPLYYYSKKGADQRLFYTPFGFYRREGPRKMTAWPLFLYASDPEKKRTSWTFANIHRHSSPKGNFFTFFPLYFQKKTDKHTDVVTPLFWVRKHAAGGSTGVIPLPPVFWDFQGPVKNWAVPPLAGHFSDARIKTSRGFALTAFWRNSPAGKLISVFPLFLYHSTPLTKDFYSLLLWIRTFKEGGSRGFLLLPPLYWDTEGSKSNWVLFPLGGRFKDTEAKTSRGFVLTAFWNRKPDSNMVTVFPLFLYKSTKDYSDLISPLFWTRTFKKGGSRGGLLLPPLFWDTSGSKTNWILLPLGGSFSDSEKNTSKGFALTAFWSRSPDKKMLMVFPFFLHRSGKEHTDLLTPLFWTRRFAAGGNRGGLLLPPMVWDTSGTKNYWMLLPFAGGFSDKETKTSRGFLLNAYWRRSPTSSMLGMFPFFLYRGDPKFKEFVSPLFWMRRYGSGGTTGGLLLPPVAWSTKGNKNWWMLMPFAGWFSDGDAKAQRAFFLNFYWRRSREGRMASLLPLFVYHKNKEMSEFISPLFWRRGYAEGGSRGAMLVPPIYWNTKGADQNFVGFPLVWVFNRPEEGLYRGFAVNTFWHINPERKHVAVIPFAYYRADKEKSDLISPLFWVRRYKGGRNSGFTLLPPVYWHVGKDRWAWGIFPLGGASANEDENTRRGHVLNFFWKSGPDERTLVGFPLLFHRRTPEVSTTALLPLYFSRAGKQRRFTTLFPLLWHYLNKETQRSFSMLLPFYAHYRNAKTKFRLKQFLLLYWAVDTAERSLRILPPIWFFSGTKTVKNYILFPLFYARTTPEGTLFATPFFLSGEKDGDQSGAFWAGPVAEFAATGTISFTARTLFPFFAAYTNKDKTFEFLMLAPLMAHWRSKDTRTWITPLGFARTSPESTKWWITLFYRFTDKESSRYGMFPLWWGYANKTEDYDRNFFVPLWFYRRSGEDKRLVTPLGFYDRSLDKEGKATVRHSLLWVYFYSGSKEKATCFFLPGYYERGPDKRTFVLFPLYWHFRNKDKMKTCFFPLWFYRRDKEVKSLITPIFWADWGKKGSQGLFYLPPVYWNRTGDRRDLAAYPFFGMFENTETGEKGGFALTAFWHGHKKKKSWGILPLAAFSSDEESGTSRGLVLNTYWKKTADTTSAFFFPLFFYNKDPIRTEMLSPLFWIYSGVGGRKKGAVFIPPVFWDISKERTAWTVFPVTGYAHDKEDQSKKGFALNTYWYKSPDRTFATVFPLFFYSRRGQDRTWASPFFWARSNGSRTSGIVPFPPAYWDVSETRTSWGILPLMAFMRDKTADTSRGFLINAYWNKSPERTMAAVFPLFFYSRRGTDRTWVSPFFWARSNGSRTSGIVPFPPAYWDVSETRTSWGILPLMAFMRDKTADTSRSFLLNTYWYKSPQRTVGTFFPLFFYRRQGADRTFVSPVCWVRSTGSRQSGIIPFPPIYWDANSKRTAWGLLPLMAFMKNKEEDTSRGFIVNTYWHKSSERTVATFFPLFFYRREGGRKDIVSPLFWARTYPEGGSRGLVLFPPVFWNTAGNQKSWGVFPLMGFMRDNTTDTSKGFFLNTYWRKSPTGEVRTFFPLYFHRRSASRETSLFVPFYFSWSNKETKAGCRIVFPVFWQFKTASGTNTRVTPVFYWSTNKNTDSLANGIPFLYHYWRTGARKKDVFILAGLVSYHRAGVNRRVYLLWFIPIPLPKADAAAAIPPPLPVDARAAEVVRE